MLLAHLGSFSGGGVARRRDLFVGWPGADSRATIPANSRTFRRPRPLRCTPRVRTHLPRPTPRTFPSAHHSTLLRQNLPLFVRTPRKGAWRCPRSRPTQSSPTPRARSARSPRVIVLASHVDGLVQVALRGRLLAGALHRGEKGAGRSPAGDTDAQRGTATSLPASSPPPRARQARLPRRRGRLLRAVSHAAAPLCGKTGAGHAPPAGGAHARTSLPPAPRAPAGSASSGPAWPAIGWGGEAGRPCPRPPPGWGRSVGTRLHTWGAGAARGRPRAAASASARWPSAAREARRPGCGRREGGPARGGRGASGCGPPPPHPAVRRASVGPGFKEEPERVAACERARVTSGAAPLGCPWSGPTRPTGWPWRSHLPSGVFENLKSKLFFFFPGNSRGYCCGLRAVNRYGREFPPTRYITPDGRRG